jgi:hypothetical protein
MRNTGLIFFLYLFICSNFLHANNNILFKKSFFDEQLGYNFFVKISVFENEKLEIKLVISNKKLEHITLKNRKIDFQSSSFMIPLENNLYFIVSPLKPCKIELYSAEEKIQLNGYQFESDSVYYYLLNAKSFSSKSDEKERVLLYIAFDDDPNVFLGIEYFFNSPIIKYFNLYKKFFMKQINNKIKLLMENRKSYISTC